MGDFYDPEYPTESGNDGKSAQEENPSCLWTSSLTESPPNQEAVAMWGEQMEEAVQADASKEDLLIFLANMKEANIYVSETLIEVYVETARLKMESLRSAVAMMCLGEYLASLEFQDAYLHISIHLDSQRYLYFALDLEHYQFIALPFGLASVSRVTRVMEALAAFVHTQGISMTIYLDNLLIKAPTEELLAQHIQDCSHILVHHGWILNMLKSSAVPCQELEFLGMRVLWTITMDYPTVILVAPYWTWREWFEDLRHIVTIPDVKVFLQGVAHTFPIFKALTAQSDLNLVLGVLQRPPLATNHFSHYLMQCLRFLLYLHLFVFSLSFMSSHLDYNREEENEAKNENSAKPAFGKTSSFKGVTSSRFLPKGTKSKVNLEEQGRQKVSFSFSFTKKTFQNRLLTTLGNDKQNESPHPAPALSPAEHISRLKMEFAESTKAGEDNVLTKPKVELGKIHFKKHLHSVTNKLPAPPPPPPPPPLTASLPVPTSPLALAQTPTVEHCSPEIEVASASLTSDLSTVTPSFVLSQTAATKESTFTPLGTKEPPSLFIDEFKGLDRKEFPEVSLVDNSPTQRVTEKAEIYLSKENSHIGKEDKSSSSAQNVKSNPSPEKNSSKSKSSHSDGAVIGSESDGDSVQTSSSHRSHELKSTTSKESEAKRKSMSLRSDDVGKYSSSRSKSGKDEKHSSYFKSDRDSRYSYSHSRSDRDRRRSRSYSRSPSRSRYERGSKSTSSYSRSERSHHYESDRRNHRSSPYRTRYSQSYSDSRTRDSSDSDEEPRRTHSRSSDSRRPSSSSHSSSYRDSRTSSYSKYDREPRRESSYENLDRRGRTSSRSEKYLKKSSERETSKKGSPQREMETSSKQGSSNSKTDSVNVGLKSNSSKVGDTKQECLNSGTRSSKWDLEKKPSRNSVGKEEYKTVKKDESIHVNISMHKKTAFSDHQQTSPIVSKKGINLIPYSINSDPEEDEGHSSSDSKKKTYALLKTKFGDLNNKSPIQGIFNLSPSETWDLVTLSTTEDMESEDQNTMEFSDNFSSVNDREETEELQSTFCNENKNIYDSPSTTDAKVKHFKGSSVQGPNNEDNAPSDLEEMKHTPTRVNISGPSSIVKPEDEQLTVSLNQSKYTCPLSNLETHNSSLQLTKVPEDEFKCLEPVYEDENSTSLRDHETKVLDVASYNPVLEKLNTLEDAQNASEKTNELTSDPASSLSISVQTQVCDIPAEEISAVKETEMAITNLDTEGIECSQGSPITPSNLCVEDLQVHSTQPVLCKESQSLAEGPLVQQQSAVKGESASLPEDVFQQSETSKTKEDDVNLHANEELEKPEVYIANLSAEELKSDLQQYASGKKRNAGEFISAINNYYSDTEESESEESDTEGTDSDDSSIPKNRLQSVVIVPKNSTIAKEEENPSSSQIQLESQGHSDTNEVTMTESIPGQSTEQLQERATEHATKQLQEHTIEQLPERVTEQLPDRETECTTEQLPEHAMECTTEQLPEHAVECTTEQLPECATEQFTESTTEQLLEHEPESTLEQLPERTPEQLPERTLEHRTEHLVERATGHLQEHAKEQLPERATESTTEQLTEIAAERTTEQLPECNAERMTEQLPERASERTTEQLPEHTTEQLQERAAERTTEQLPERAAECTTEQLPEDATERTTEQLPERTTEQLPERMTESTTEQLPEHATKQERTQSNSPEHTPSPERTPVQDEVENNCDEQKESKSPSNIYETPEISSLEPSKQSVQTCKLDPRLHHIDVVVSTSQPEVTAENSLNHNVAQEPLTLSYQSCHQEHMSMPSPPVSNQHKSLQQPLAGSAAKPDSGQGRAVFDPPQRLGNYSRGDGFQPTEDLNCFGWDFSQPEKPTSTCQQPDSSYVYFGYNYQQGCAAYDAPQGYSRDNGYYDPRLHQKPPEGIYEKPCGQVPDSVTDFYDEEEDEDFGWEAGHGEDFLVQSNMSFGDVRTETGSVQANEISSNSTKENIALREKRQQQMKTTERSDMKDRGPLKKRRQEREGDSDFDADALLKRKQKGEAGLMDSTTSKQGEVGDLCSMDDFRDSQHWKDFSKQGKMPPYFDLIEENVYLTERKKNKSHRDIKRMQCECPLLSKEERAQGDVACGEDCLNRLLMIECSSRCPNGEYCSNRRFQRKQHAGVEVILTEKKGWGLRAAKDLKPNTFVLEYCGEVLDHKEFKARVKEYARNKNIHYYFMALKNDEIIDATQKGNCSRFMNHSCDPNCETQKWTVNGQLRVGFFTTRLVPAGSELTFDYQFQRYGKEAQKCFCGSANCRGYLGGENRVSIRAAGGKMKKERSRKKDSVDGELEALLENGEGLSDKNQVLSLSRLMVRIETLEQKLTCLKLIKNTQSQSCLKFFLECHGLSLLWIWMAELGDSRGNTSNSLKLQLEIIKALELLPIPNKNMLEESKILPIIQRWSQTKTAIPPLSEGDGYSSENTSRAHTPLNTPTNTSEPASKLSIEIDGETPKKLVLRRLKIISENSMDSAASDAASELEVKEAAERTDVQANVEVKDNQLPKDQELKEEIKPEDGTPPKKEEPPASEEQKPPPETKSEAEPQPNVSKAESPDIEMKDNNGVKVEEAAAVETPSQDEEEGVSDVESERSQDPTYKMLDMSELATRLLDGWKDLKEVYRIPKKSQAEKENYDRWRDSSGSGYLTPNSKTPSRERESERQSQRKRRQSPSPPSFYERSSKRAEDSRFDTPASSKKKSRVQDRNKLSTEERRKLFEQEVAQREAQKQQQQMQNMAISSPIPYESLPYGAQLPPPFITYPQGYPIQSFVDPTNPNAGKVLLPTPPLDAVPSPNSYDPSQGMVVNPPLMPPQQVPVVQHVPAPMEVPQQQYVAQGEPMVSQEANVAVLPVPAPSAVPSQNYGIWDPNQQAVAIQQQQSQPQYPPPAPQAAIYYQGQACQTVYGMPAAYTQPPPPMVQSYTQPGLQYIPGQQIYATHPQGVVVQQAPTVTTLVAPGQPQALQQPEMGLPPNSVLDLPPPSPPKPKTIVLPPSWKTARDPEGKIYYYHVITRQTQWDPPTWDSPGDDGGSLEHEAEMDLGTPTYDESPMKSSKKTKTAEADTSSELAKKSKEVFRKEMSQFIVQCLNPYRKPDCKNGRINTTEDFKHLARKLTHGVMNKELKYCKNPEDLDCNENVKHKTKEYIKKYMQKFGSVYKPKEDVDFE
ncbi:histone-lysine N-methyltransferase SETD2 [Rhinophrynus dorsalis]